MLLSITPPKKVLMIVSDENAHWDELADAFHGFNDAHWQVTMASPRGHPKVDARSLVPNSFLHWLGRATIRARLPRTEFFGHPVVEGMQHARKLSEVSVADYDVIYVVGTFGPARDLATNAEVGRVLREGVELERWFAGRLDAVGAQGVLDPYYGSQGRLREIVTGERWVSCRSPRRARRVAWTVVRQLSGEADHLRHHHTELRRPEFLDRKTG